jgi:hypothetical protein
MKALSSSKIVIAYRSQGDGNYIRAIIGEINGNNISFGSEKLMNDDTNHRADADISVAALSSSKFAFLYRDDLDASDISKVVIGTVSGTTISNGDQYSFDTKKAYYSTIASLDETSIIVTYVTFGPNTGYCIVGDVSGTTISWGNKYTYTTTYV